MLPTSNTTLPNQDSAILNILRREWTFIFGGVFFLYLFVCMYMSGWRITIIPDLSTPYGYNGDLIFHSWMIRRVMEGWLFENPRSGYPFGSTFLDYPGSDLGNHIILKFFGSWIGNFFAAINIYFVSGFVFTYFASYFSLRMLSLSAWLSLSGAIIFSIVPFHFLRLPHLFYTFYFVVPIYYYIGTSTFFKAKIEEKWTTSRWIKIISALLISACFGAYYALFGAIVIGACGIAGFFSHGRWSPLITSTILVLTLMVGVLFNIAPNLQYRITNGINPEVAQRSPAEAELYGLKFIQLILPQQDHRSALLSAISAKYDSVFPLVNENRYATLGAIGSLGLVLALGIIAARLSGREVDLRLCLLTLIIAMLFMFGTIGGFGTLFALTISSMIRGWNRISIFIAFGTITCFLIFLQININRFVSAKRAEKITALLAFFLIILAILDQVPPRTQAAVENIEKTFSADRSFIANIEATTRIGAAIYQLPYIAFPEVPPLHQMGPYAPLIGYLHSNTLRWSSGGMKGRPGDLFFRALAREPLDRQLGVIRRLGFTGIYIDKNGYGDNGHQIIGQLTTALGHGPDLERADGRVAFFRLPDAAPVTLEGLTPIEIMEKAGYIVDEMGVRYDASLKDGIDFSRRGLPSFVRSVRGLSQAEPWAGRWSDANLAPAVRFEFNTDLPEDFILVADITVFGPNAGAPLIVKVGTKQYQAILPANEGILRIPVQGGVGARSIEFVPPNPTSPSSIMNSSDDRKLGIGFRKIGFEIK